MKIILFANTDWYLYNFRLPLVRAIRATGHELILLSPPGKYVGKIRGEGFDWRPLPLSRRGINPFEEWKSIRRISKLYRAEKPDLVHHFTIKSVLYGSLAAKRARVPRVVNAVTGMGYLFSTHNLFTAFARPIVKLLYRWLLRGTTVIFQNQRDLDVFLKQRMAEKDASVLIPGSGVDIDHFSPGPTPEGPPIVLLPARMLYDKGVAEFVEAARKLKMEKINARFVLAGASDPGNPSSIPEDQLNQWEQEGILEWWGWQDDMAAVYRSAAIVCLPSYREGLAKSLIEAAACGKPLIASDIPGCREVAREGVNGLLVPPKDAIALASAIRTLLESPEKMKIMGAASRKIAVEEYAAARIAAETISIYNR